MFLDKWKDKDNNIHKLMFKVTWIISFWLIHQYDFMIFQSKKGAVTSLAQVHIAAKKIVHILISNITLIREKIKWHKG